MVFLNAVEMTRVAVPLQFHTVILKRDVGMGKGEKEDFRSKG